MTSIRQTSGQQYKTEKRIFSFDFALLIIFITFALASLRMRSTHCCCCCCAQTISSCYCFQYIFCLKWHRRPFLLLPFTLYSQFFLFVSLYGTSRKSMDLAILHFMSSNLLAIRMSCRKLCTSLSKYVMPLGVLFLCVVPLRHWDVVALRCCCVDSYIIYYTYICMCMCPFILESHRISSIS